MQCPVDNQLVGFIDGQLEEKFSLQVEAHLRTCLSCRSRLTLLADGSDTIPNNDTPENSKVDFVDDPDRRPLKKTVKYDSRQPGSPSLEKTTDLAEGDHRQECPSSIGRYKIIKRLGAGAFGTVFLARDEQLERDVAVKIAHRERIKSPRDAELYQREARLLAKMEHTGIVPVYDSGLTDDGLVFIVSRFVKGRDLADLMGQEKFPVEGAVELVVSIANALHYMHSNGIIHRDVKPGNILVDSDGKAYLTDFGLAILEEEIVSNREIVGTLSYMSPEQFNGDGHLVGPRADIFSLGVLLFELLSGHRPFKDRTTNHPVERMFDVPRLRDVDPTLPQALDRICLKAMQERSSDRFSTAREFANELTQFLTDPLKILTENRQVQLVYRGLRAFRQVDHEFFCQLLPGMRSSRGNPEMVQFWLNRIQEERVELQPRIGVIYGTTGSGKSSLVNAAIVPKINSKITVISVQASPNRTEADLADQFKKVFRYSEEVTALPEMCRHIRKRQPPFANERVLIVIDQFEQWLHGRHLELNLELIQAIRQCDGHSIQCLLIVRDDFWVELSGFMRAVEEPMRDGENMMAVEPFSIEHAQKVLSRIGEIVKGNESDAVMRALFVERGIQLIQTDGYVSPVRLALFVEMTKNFTWEPETIRHFKDLKALGHTYIKQQFDPEACARRYRTHIPAIKLLLAALLPEQGNDLKGQDLSLKELRTVCGYENRPEGFTQLIDLLDRDFRIISPVSHGESTDHDTLNYQLTHDYLVPAIRAWLDEEELRTFQGRARIKLKDRSSLWRMKREVKQLPGLVDLFHIVIGTKHSGWTPEESKLMKTASRRIASQTIGIAVIIFLLVFLFSNRAQNSRDAEILTQLTQVSASDVPSILDDLGERLPRMESQVNTAFEAAPVGSREKNRLALAKLQFDQTDTVYLQQQLLQSPINEFGLIVSEMLELEMSFDVFEEAVQSGSSREKFRAACALLASSTEDDPDQQIIDDVVTNLVQQSRPSIVGWMNWLSRYEDHLTPKLIEIFRSGNLSESTTNAAVALSRLLRNDNEQYLQLLLRANEKQLPILCDVVEDSSTYSDHLQQWLVDHPSAGVKTIVNALTSFAHLGAGEYLMPYFMHRDDPSLRSLLIENMTASRVDPQFLIEILHEETSAPAIAASLLILGSGDRTLFSESQREQLGDVALKHFQNHADPEVHSASEWVLNQFGEHPTVSPITPEELEDKHFGWYVTTVGDTMVIPDQKAVISTASDDTSENADGAEFRWSFAICTKEVTVEQFRKFQSDFRYNEIISPLPKCPINSVNQDGAMAYCNWLTVQDGMTEEDCCYEVTAKGRYKPLPDFFERKGYRLPLEQEWEIGARAGTSTLYSFGATNELLNRYAWYLENSEQHAHPVGTLFPNQYGLFDVSGNMSEWCQSSLVSVSPSVSFDDSAQVSVRGGAFRSSTSQRIPFGPLQATTQYKLSYRHGQTFTGFRIAKTIGFAQ